MAFDPIPAVRRFWQMPKSGQAQLTQWIRIASPDIGLIMLSLGVTTSSGQASAMDDVTKVKQILWEVWDPIGVNGEPDAFGEYDSYAPHILNLLQSGASEEQLANALDHITNDLMGLGTGGHKNAIAALLALRMQ